MPLPQTSPPPAGDEPQEPRTYAVTGGRTRANHTLPLEAQLMAGAPGAQYPLSAEAVQVVAACGTRSVSVAEIAAAIRRPVWAAKVLISDLLDSGALRRPVSAGADPARDPDVLRLVLDGLLRWA
ncbi:DUF742 domain-containing protein [Actinacidiphila sp. ITFR-21]|uniref:DUF742 domain-containing protein n=1 Tax=Actinacidiphila sp. ITFR-21 TaxID=3075199 RepID=UPI00288B4C1B|nr:DUF742 domain-containing protein [Streptomyces sp. ITFR-21]WNI19962.1 DUF742 domain-containing protein [Streptomyces sp. ITFR-21]